MLEKELDLSHSQMMGKIKEFEGKTVKICQTALLQSGHDAMPGIWVNTEDRPDLLELGHSIYNGDTNVVVENAWHFAFQNGGERKGLAILASRVLDPVQAEWAILFPLPSLEVFLRMILTYRKLIISFKAPPEITSSILVVFNNIEDLKEGLETYRQMAAAKKSPTKN